MKLPRRRFLHLAAGATALSFAPHVGRAQAYPARAVRIVVGFPPGGNSDILGRLTGQWLSERLGQSFIVENRTGAAANIAAEAVARSAPDGYTILLMSVNHAIGATLYDKLNFDFRRDIMPVASIATGGLVLVCHPSLRATTVPELIAFAKANPGEINMASPGHGGINHIAGELLKMLAGINMVHVPYRGDAPAITDLLGGHVQVFFGTLSGAIEHIRSGTLRALAVTTPTRSNALPDIPALSEFFPGCEATLWNGLGAPRNTPSQILEKLNKEVQAGLADPKIKARLAEMGSDELVSSQSDFERLVIDETEKWSKVIKFAGIKAE